LARRVSTTRSAIARLEAGEVAPRWDTVLQLVTASDHVTTDIDITRPD
jgi:predicted transcriptional regulator